MTNVELVAPRCIRLEWVITCCVCKKEERHPPELVDPFGYVDSDPVQVRLFHNENWESDGLGRWMCKGCYEIWKLDPST